MHFLSLSLSLWAVFSVIVAAAGQSQGSVVAPFDFYPLNTTTDFEEVIGNLPLIYNFNTSNSQSANQNNSWWLSAYLYGSDNHEYLVVSHILDYTHVNGMTIYRASIFDITDKTFTQFTKNTSAPDVFANSQEAAFNVSINDGEFTFGSTLPGSATKQLRTTSKIPGMQFDIPFDLSAPIILNAGTGGYFALGSMETAEWSMVAGNTSGELVKNNATVTVNTEKSFTWYDRQWNTNGIKPNWTWFELHLTDSSNPPNDDKMSIWIYDSKVIGRRQWATSSRPGTGVGLVIPLQSFEPFGETWTSPNSNLTYAQNWNVSLQDGTNLTISSYFENQELGPPTTVFTYEGFVTVTGTRSSGETISGYGLVEINYYA